MRKYEKFESGNTLDGFDLIRQPLLNLAEICSMSFVYQDNKSAVFG